MHPTKRAVMTLLEFPLFVKMVAEKTPRRGALANAITPKAKLISLSLPMDCRKTARMAKATRSIPMRTTATRGGPRLEEGEREDAREAAGESGTLPRTGPTRLFQGL